MSFETLRRDVEFLKSYVGLPCRYRRVVAEHWAREFRATRDEELRKVAMLQLFEQTIASTEDLCIFYFALMKLGDAPVGVIDFCDTCWVKDYEKQWVEELEKIPADSHFLIGHLPLSGVEVPDDAADRVVVDRAFKKLTNGLRAAAQTRVVGDRMLVESRNKLTHGTLIRDVGDVIYLDVTKGQQSALPVTEEYAGIFEAAVRAMRQANAVIAWALLQKIHFATASGAYGLDAEQTQTLLPLLDSIPTSF